MTFHNNKNNPTAPTKDIEYAGRQSDVKINKYFLVIIWASGHANRLKPIKQFPHQQLVELAEYTEIRGTEGCPQSPRA